MEDAWFQTQPGLLGILVFLLSAAGSQTKVLLRTLRACIHIYRYTHMCVYIYIYAHICTRYMYIHEFVTCEYVYIYTYTHTHTEGEDAYPAFTTSSLPTLG